MKTEDSIESVEVVDKLMSCFRNRLTPTDEILVKAYELGINVKALKDYMVVSHDIKEDDSDWTEEY